MSDRLRQLFRTLSVSTTYQYMLLLVIALLAAALRFYKLGEWSLWIDEIFTIGRANAHVNLDTIIAQWWHPSISLILTGMALEQLGVSAWSARLVPAIIGVLSVIVLYFPVKRWFGPVVALVTMLLLAVSPWHLEWSQNARYYSSLLLLYFLAAFAFNEALEKDRPILLLLAGLLLVLSIGERFVAFMLAPVIVLYLLALALLPIDKPKGYNARNLSLISIPAILFLLIEIARFLKTGSSYFLGAVELTYNLPIHDPFRLASFIAFDIGVALITLALFAGVYLVLRRNRTGIFVVLNAVIPVGILLLANPFYFTRDRYVFMVLPFWLVLAGFAVKEIGRSMQGRATLLAAGVLALLIADAMGDNLLYYHVNNGNRLDWKRAFALAEEQSKPGDQYVTWWPQFGPYYLNNKEIISWGDIDPEFVKTSGQRFWFVLDEETIWGNGAMKRWIEDNGELIDILYLRGPGEDYLRIYLYDPNK